MTSRDRSRPDGRPTDPLARLARLNATAVFLAALVYVLIGLFAPGVLGGALLLLLAGGLGWVMARTWPVQPPTTRMIRLTALVALIGVALLKIL